MPRIAARPCCVWAQPSRTRRIAAIPCPARRRSGAARRERAHPGLCRHGRRRSRLSRLHLRHDEPAERRAARPSRRLGPTADAGALDGARSRRRDVARRRDQLDLYAWRRRRRSAVGRGPRGALQRASRSRRLAASHRNLSRDDLRRRARRLSADPQIWRAGERPIYRACAMGSRPAPRWRRACSPNGAPVRAKRFSKPLA